MTRFLIVSAIDATALAAFILGVAVLATIFAGGM